MDSFNKSVNCRYGTFLANENDRVIGRSVLYYGEYYQSEIELFKQIVKPGWCVADVGANIGTHTVALANIVGDKGWVYAFEPQRLVYQTLCANLANNSIINVDAEKMALGRTDDVILVEDIDPTRELDYGGVHMGRGQDYGVLATLDSYIQKRNLHFMKIDVEGMELDCLLGAKETLERCNTILYLENDKPHKSKALLEHLEQIKYDCYWHLSLFHNPNNFADQTEPMHGCGYSETDDPLYLGNCGFGVNMLCVPKSFNFVADADTMALKVKNSDEHPFKKEKSRFHE